MVQPNHFLKFLLLKTMSLSELKKPALLRLARRAGVKRMVEIMYEELRGICQVWLEDTIRDSMTYMEYARRRTLMLEDIEPVVNATGRDLPHKHCGGSKPTKAASGGKKRRAKPGTGARRDIKSAQKQADCLEFGFEPFKRLVRSIVGENRTPDARVSADSFKMLQERLESYLVKLMHDAYKISVARKSVTLQPRDIQLARSIRGENSTASPVMEEQRFQQYIKKVLRQVNPDAQISDRALSQVNYVLNVLGNAIAVNAIHLTHHANAPKHGRRKPKKEEEEEAEEEEEEGTAKGRKKVKNHTVSSRAVQSAVKLLLSGMLREHGISAGIQAVTELSASNERKKERKSMASRARLQFAPARARKILKSNGANRMGGDAPVYLAAVLEYLAAEMLELADNVARNNKRMRLFPRDLMLALHNDHELNLLMNQHKVDIVGSGSVPDPASSLAAKPKPTKRKGPTLNELREEAAELKIKGRSKLRKALLVAAIAESKRKSRKQAK